MGHSGALSALSLGIYHKTMTTKNSITGDMIRTRPATKEYQDNWDRIFGNEKDSEADGDAASLQDADIAVPEETPETD